MPTKKAQEVKIRMYRQGLGDCFLLSFPARSGEFHMLIDCGALVSRHYGDPEMEAVVRDIQARTNKRLNLVAATHEHWDHISGFHQAQHIFADKKEMRVDRVWVAWTEDEDNEAARRLKDEFKKGQAAVEMALARMTAGQRGGQLGLYRQAIEELLGFSDGAPGVAGALGAGGKKRTAAAWEILLNLGERTYCHPQDSPRRLPGVAGVRVYVLGPPEDPEYVRRRLSSVETYDEGRHGFGAFGSFRAAVAGPDGAGWARALPFDERHAVRQDAAAQQAFFRRRYGFDPRDDEAWRRIDDDWLDLAGELTLHLDSYTNNTCLALAIELVESGQVLLFPGDAQVGNWLSWGTLSWRVDGPDGRTRRVTVDDLLARTVFYKVGHHGSHNATLRARGLEKMTSPDLVAMIPVHRATARDQDWKFPYPPLWERLKQKARGRVLLADADDFGEMEQEARRWLTDAEWRRFKRATTFDKNKLFIEYRVPLGKQDD